MTEGGQNFGQLVIEIMDMESCTQEGGEETLESLEKAIHFYFNDLSDANNSQESKIRLTHAPQTLEEAK